MGFANYPPSRFFTLMLWVSSILAVVTGALAIYTVYLRGIVSLSHGVIVIGSLLFMLLGGAFITNQLHYTFIWEPREDRYGELALKSAMNDIPKLIRSLGYDNWLVTNPDEFNIRFEYIIKGNILADFKLHTHTITASYADSRYKLWFEGYYVDEEIEYMINQIINNLSKHFGHEYDINGLKLKMHKSPTKERTA